MLKKLDYSLALLSLYAIRPAIYGASISDALVVGFLVGLYCYKRWIAIKEQVKVNDDVRAEIKDLRSSINNISIARSMNRL